MSQQYYIRVRGKVSGPYDLYQLRTLQERGGLARFHEISTDQQNWVPALALSELFPSGGAAPPDMRRPEEPAEAYNQPAQDSAADEPIWHFIDRQGSQQGPTSLRQLEQLFRSGQLDAGSLAWKPGMADWLALPAIDAMRFGAARGSSPEIGFGASPGGYASDPSTGWRKIQTGISLLTLGVFVLAVLAFLSGILGFIGFLAPAGTLIALVIFITVNVLAAVQSLYAVVALQWIGASRRLGSSAALPLICLILSGIVFALFMTYLIMMLDRSLFRMGDADKFPMFRDSVLYGTMTQWPGAMLLSASILFSAEATLIIYHVRGVMVRLGAMGLGWHMWMSALLYLVLAFLGVVVHVLVLLRFGVPWNMKPLVFALLGLFLWLLAMGWSAYALISLQRIRGTLADWIARSYPR